MIKSDDSLREKLHISNEIFQKLTYFQMKSLNFILDNPPQSFLRAISTCSSSKLIKHLVHLNISLHAGEYPYNLFESYLRDIIVDWRIIQEDRIKLLNAISRFISFPFLYFPFLYFTFTFISLLFYFTFILHFIIIIEIVQHKL